MNHIKLLMFDIKYYSFGLCQVEIDLIEPLQKQVNKDEVKASTSSFARKGASDGMDKGASAGCMGRCSWLGREQKVQEQGVVTMPTNIGVSYGTLFCD